MFYEDVSQFMPRQFNEVLLGISFILMLVSCFGEYCAQLQDSKWYRENVYRTYGKEEVDQWTHHPYWFGTVLLEIAKLPGRLALLFPNTDPATWIYNGIKISKVMGYVALVGAAPFELYKVIQGETSHPEMPAGIGMAIVGMIVGFFAGRGQCFARDTGLRNISAYLAYILNAKNSRLRIPTPEGHRQWPGLWCVPHDNTPVHTMRDITHEVSIATETYKLARSG